jgi:hypothetical protein
MNRILFILIFNFFLDLIFQIPILSVAERKFVITTCSPFKVQLLSINSFSHLHTEFMGGHRFPNETHKSHPQVPLNKCGSDKGV